MLSKLLFVLGRGSRRIQQNAKLAFLAVILFVFPLLFIVVLEQFYTVAAANTQTAEQQRVGAFQDAITATLQLGTTDPTEVMEQLATRNRDITKLRIYELLPNGTVIISTSIDESEIGATSSVVAALSASRLTPGESVSIPIQTATGRVIQVVRFVEKESAEWFVFSEHDRSSFDGLLAQRKLDAYLLLSFLFVFMIALAYWISRQVDWKDRHDTLESSLKERDLFSNMIAHEFRTPLTAIKGYASFLQESKTLTQEEKRFVDTIRESTERLVLLVNDFLEVARIQSGRMKIETEEIDVRQTFEAVLESLKGEAAQKGLHLVYTPALKVQLLTTDKNRFIQILTNIISNSVKYTDAGTVEVSAEEDRTGLTIRIKDTGMGISADDQQKLFAPFSRVGGVEHTTTTGTGLGMWITKQLVELLGGTIAIESIKGVGTHVVMHFRRAK